MPLLRTISLSVEPCLVSAAIRAGAVDKLSTRQGRSYRETRASQTPSSTVKVPSPCDSGLQIARNGP